MSRERQAPSEDEREATGAPPLFSEAAYAAVADVELEDLGSGDSEPDEAFVEAKPATGRKARAKAKAKAAKAEAAAAVKEDKSAVPTLEQDDDPASPGADEELQIYQSRQERLVRKILV